MALDCPVDIAAHRLWPRDLDGQRALFWAAQPRLNADDPYPPPLGAAYDPEADSWRIVAPGPPETGDCSSEVWTGRLLLWIGCDRGDRGGIPGRSPHPDGDLWAGDSAFGYDVESDAWLDLPDIPSSAERQQVAVWAGDRVVVLRADYDDDFMTAHSWAPGERTWTPLTPPEVEANWLIAGVWTGSEIVFIHGESGPGWITPEPKPGTVTQAAYEPATDTWRPIITSPAVMASTGSRKFWTGNEVLLLHLSSPDSMANAYDPTTDSWRHLGSTLGRESIHTSVEWTGEELLIWGGNADDMGGGDFRADGVSLRP